MLDRITDWLESDPFNPILLLTGLAGLVGGMIGGAVGVCVMRVFA